MSRIATPLLDSIHSPAELRKVSIELLPQLAEELRAELIDTVSVTGGHLGAGLGVVELTIALHYMFDTPFDRLVWDVGHQAYPHKILTERRDRIRTLRQQDGLSGFTKRKESLYDSFGAGHSSTSISAGLGMAMGSSLQNIARHVIAVIGDGAMSAGMAYEAMNNAGGLDAQLIVILNDNDMSIAPPVGAMSAYLARLISSPAYRVLRERAKSLSKKLPQFFMEKAKRTEEYTRGFFAGGTLFEELGFYYIGPIDGHNFHHLLPVLKNVRDFGRGPVLIHTVTHKGKGYAPAEAALDKYHGVNRFDVVTGKQVKASSSALSYTKVFASALIEEAKHDDKIIAITAAMPAGTGLDLFAHSFPSRIFDVGIAEQHAVTFAGGLACEGLKPFVALYSTFLQRAYDQVIHDISLQNLPVRFAIDRAGFVGADGATHAGSFDIAYLTTLPGLVVMAPADGLELMHMVRTAAAYEEGPIAFRYPRGDIPRGDVLRGDIPRGDVLRGDIPSGHIVGEGFPQRGELLEIGKGRILCEGEKVALVSFGTRLHEALLAADCLKQLGIATTVADARFAKPLDELLIARLAREHEVLVTIEEGSENGFGARILQFLSRKGLLDHGLKCRTITFPDLYLDQGDPDKVLSQIGLDHKGIVKTVCTVLGYSYP